MKRLTVFSIVLLVAILCVAGFMSGEVYALESIEKAPVSKGLIILSNRSAMAISGKTGADLAFEPDDFERALNLRRVDYITFTELPDPALGALYLGSTPVSVGTTVSRENIHKLYYVEKGQGISSNSFTFTTGNGYSIECAVYMLTEDNYCPVATGVSMFAPVDTYRNVSVYGTLNGKDNEGDPLTYEIVAYPKNGSVMMNDPLSGEFCYTPASDYVGKDSFIYVVRDKYGNYSASKDVEIEVSPASIKGVLSDMGGNRAHSAAITLVEKGIMSAEKNESSLVFSPNGEVTREDFLVMVMKAAGVKINEANATDFADDADISSMAKSYVATAKELGYITGSQTSGASCFDPKRAITVAEAAVIVNNVIDGGRFIDKDMAITTVFSDHLDIPAWAENAILTLNYVGIYSASGGYVYPNSTLCRDDAALMIASVVEVSSRDLS